MSDRLSRKEIKHDIQHDEFTDVVGRSVEYAETHSRALLIGLGAVLALAVVVAGFFLYLGSRRDDASAALAEAVEVFEAPILAADTAATPPPADSSKPTFPNEAARNARAKQMFTEVRESYGLSDAADVAGLYLGRIAASEGDMATARRLWAEFVDDHPDHFLASQTRLNLFQLDRQEGKGEEVVGRLRALLDESEPALPKDVALYELGQTYEHMKRGTDAQTSYQKLLDEYPQSGYAQLAEQRLTALDPARPGAGAAGALGALGGLGGPGGPGSPF
jgi:tetratricopeptide (TPR) repeat protein